ncbi:TnsA-like heteromeric transposase endonuclease subunit, partial [Streptomyces sp. NPDC088178]
RTALGAGWNVRFEDVPPVRGFRWSKGDRSFPGWYYAVTTGGHVGYESWLERGRLILLDFAPDVVGIASQPFRLHWREGEEKRRHAPDYFVRLADGRARVVDVRAEDDVDERTARRSPRPSGPVRRWVRSLRTSGSRIRCSWRICGGWPAAGTGGAAVRPMSSSVRWRSSGSLRGCGQSLQPVTNP